MRRWENTIKVDDKKEGIWRWNALTFLSLLVTWCTNMFNIQQL